MSTIFITGASSGIGKATVKLFQRKGWNVIATMRNPKSEFELIELKNVTVLPCDVTDISSIKNAILEGIKLFGKIDVLVNNAGYYAIGPIEAATHEQIQQQINTNLLGLISVTREIIPYFRKQNQGIVINISSIAGIISIPLQSLYHASKWGIEGFSESLQYELQQHNIRVKIIEPGVIKTDFYGRSMTMLQDNNLQHYDAYSQKVVSNILGNADNGSSPNDVAKTIYQAATDNKKKLRYPTGKSKEMPLIRKILPLNLFRTMVKNSMEK